MKKIFSILISLSLLLFQYDSIRAQDIPTGKFLGSYYNGKNFDTLVFTREDPVIAFEWWRSSPGVGIYKENFSVRWQGRFEFTAGDWEFSVKPDDGVRVYIDGDRIIDSWKPQYGVFLKSVKYLSAGSHLIVVEYYEEKEWAGITFGWKKVVSAVPTSPGGATAKPGTVVPTTSPLYNSLYVSSCEELALNPNKGDAPLEVEFSGAGYDPYGKIQSYSFNFGDKTQVLTQEDSYASHIYEKPGAYTVTLTIKDSKGALRTSDVCKKTVSVGGFYEEGIGGYAEPTVYPEASPSSLPKTGIFDSALWLIFLTVPMAVFGILLNRKFSKL